MGKIYNSKYRSGHLIAMHKKLKIINGYKDDTPGPGAYQHFSQFGIWVPKDKTEGYNVRKRIKTANNSRDKSIREYFRKKRERAITENNSRERRGRIFSALR